MHLVRPPSRTGPSAIRSEAWDELGRIRRRGLETTERLRWMRANYVDQFVVKSILLEGATQDEAASRLGLSKRDVSTHAKTPYQPTDAWQVDSEFLAHVFGSAEGAAAARRTALRYDARTFAPSEVYHPQPPVTTGVVAVLRRKGGAGGDVVTFGLSSALAIDAARDVYPVHVDATIEGPNVTWSAVRRARADSLVVVDCSASNDQVDAVLGEADVIVYVLPVDPRVEDETTGSKPAWEATIDPLVAGDPRLLVVVNDGAGAQPPRRRSPGEPGGVLADIDVFRVPFDERIAAQGYSEAVEFHEFAADTWTAFMRLADAVVEQLRRRR